MAMMLSTGRAGLEAPLALCTEVWSLDSTDGGRIYLGNGVLNLAEQSEEFMYP